MNKKIMLLLGGNKLNYGIYNKFKKLNYLVYVIDWNKEPQIKGDRHYQIDVKDTGAIIEALKKDNVLDKVAFVYTSIDLAVKSVAKINEAIGLATITPEGLKYSSSKSMMTKKWDDDGLLNRFSKKFENYDEEIYNLNQKYKLIIKPDNSASSRGITIIAKNSSNDILQTAFNKAKDEASNNIVVVEEFVEGTEHTVEMLGDKYGNVSVYAISQKTHTKHTNNNRIAVKLHYNSEPIELQNKIAQFAIKCYKSLNFSSSFGHLEVILKEDGTLSPVEIGARSSGFIASDLVDIASGANYMGDLIEVQNGAKIKEGLHPQTQKSSLLFFYDFPENLEIKNKSNLLEFLDNSITSRYFDRTNIEKGNIFKKIENDNARLGYEILEGPKDIMTKEYINEKEKEMIKFIFGEI